MHLLKNVVVQLFVQNDNLPPILAENSLSSIIKKVGHLFITDTMVFCIAISYLKCLKMSISHFFFPYPGLPLTLQLTCPGDQKSVTFAQEIYETVQRNLYPERYRPKVGGGGGSSSPHQIKVAM